MSTQHDSTPNAPAEAPDKGVVCDALVSILEGAAQIAEHGIPYYAYGDNEAACEMASRLKQLGDEIRCALALAEDRAARNANKVDMANRKA